MKRRKLVAAVAAAAVVVALVSSGVADARVGNARGVTSDSIVVAGLGYSVFYADSGIGAQARFNVENDKGGINGRTIDFKGWNDDKSDPTTDLAEARRLVQQEQVFAVVPVITPYLGSAPFLEQQHVPFLGWAISTGFCDNDYGWGFTGCIVPPPPVKTAGATWGQLVNDLYQKQGDTKGAKGKTAAVIAEDNDSGNTGVKVIGASAKAAGMKVVYQKASVPAPPATVGDYSPYVNAIMTSNGGQAPDVAFLVTAFSNVAGLQKGLLQAGYKGIITNAVQYDPRIVASAQGSTVFTQFAVPEAAATNPQMQRIVDQIKAVAGDQTITQAVLAGYLSADMFVKIAKKAGKNLTPETFAAAGKKFRYQIPKVVGPTKYPAGRKVGTPCGSLVQSDGTKYNVAVDYSCFWNITLGGKKLPY